MDKFHEIWPLLSVIVGAVAAYFGAFNAMRERMAKIEARQDGHDDDIRELRASVARLDDRVNRYIESRK